LCVVKWNLRGVGRGGDDGGGVRTGLGFLDR
jgi:hypothetical protein